MKSIIFLILLFVMSCCVDDDNYYYFTDEQEELFFYTNGYKFDLLALPDYDTICCEVVSDSTYFENRKYPLLTPTYYANILDVNIQSNYDLKFNIQYSYCLEGFYVYLIVDDGSRSKWYNIETEGEVDNSYSVFANDIIYDNLIILTSGLDTLFFSPDYGIVRFTNSDTKKSYCLIE
ncbi:MAG: hypothetical protein PF436_08330 [Prolixibacteraceae bacterium]|jgi:hypothetical protein|nr:hypothetical protein [Prolixibacteraceae bacterium]